MYGLVDELNDTETEMIGMKPKDAIKLKEVSLVTWEAYPPEEVLPEDGLYWYLLQPSEEHDDQWHRATDRIWSKTSYRLRELILVRNLTHPFGLIKLLFSQCCSFLRNSYLIKTFWRIGTESAMHSKLHFHISFWCVLECLATGTLCCSCVKFLRSLLEIAVWHFN